MNVAYNGVGEDYGAYSIGEVLNAVPDLVVALDPDQQIVSPLRAGQKPFEREAIADPDLGRRPGCKGKVKVNEGDAWSVPLII